MCGNTISLQHAALESAPPDINNMAANAGYVEGVNDPAVFWLNGICASTGVGIIHGIVSGFFNIDSGIDWIYEFPKNEWHKTNTEYLHNDDCLFCSMSSEDDFNQETDSETVNDEDTDFMFDSSEFESNEFGNTQFGNTEFGNTGLGNTKFENNGYEQPFDNKLDSDDSDFIIW